MGCTHPFGFERIRRADGTAGIRCPSCKSVAYKGDTLWTCIKRNIFGLGS